MTAEISKKNLSKLKATVAQPRYRFRVNASDSVYMKCRKAALALGKQVPMPDAATLVATVNALAAMTVSNVQLDHVTAVTSTADNGLYDRARQEANWALHKPGQLWHVDANAHSVADGTDSKDGSANTGAHWLLVVGDDAPAKYRKNILPRYWDGGNAASNVRIVYWRIVAGYVTLLKWMRETMPVSDAITAILIPQAVRSHAGYGNSIVPFWRQKEPTMADALGDVDRWFTLVNNVKLTLAHDQALAKAHRALPFMTKKHINMSAKQAVAASGLTTQDAFRAVEIDNDVDVAKFASFAKTLTAKLPKLPALKAPVTLRLRKLRNYKALGMFYPATNDLVVDFRVTVGKAGIDSFTHEYGHALDTTYGDLSMQPAFAAILAAYQADLRSRHVAKYNYYATPTECFARCFEVWQAAVKHATTLVDSMASYQQDGVYGWACQHVDQLDAYFTSVFGDTPDAADVDDTADVDDVASAAAPADVAAPAATGKPAALADTAQPAVTDHYEQLSLF